MACSHVAHNGQLGNHVILANGALLGGYVEAGDNVFFAGSVAIHQFVKIGRLTMVGGHSLITKDIPPFCMTKSGAYNRLAGLNTVGLRRAGISPPERSEIRQAYKLLFHSGINVTEAKARLKEEFPTGPAAEFGQFLESSSRGICSGRPSA
jgi:UDP-N-acetylglucosamine acyltransferase